MKNAKQLKKLFKRKNEEFFKIHFENKKEIACKIKKPLKSTFIQFVRVYFDFQFFISALKRSLNKSQTQNDEKEIRFYIEKFENISMCINLALLQLKEVVDIW